MQPWLSKTLQILAPTLTNSSLLEKLYSALGGFIGILAVAIISHHYADPQSAWLMTASMGASAVLLFAAPHGPMSQPWPVFGGHMVSAITALTFSLYLLPWIDPLLILAITVGVSIFAMYALGCLHPPGGATALTIVLSAEKAPSTVNFDFLAFPLLLNLVVILIIAVFFHSLGSKKYPVFFAQNTFRKRSENQEQMPDALSHEEFLSALAEIDSFVDINEQELRRILELTQVCAPTQPLIAEQLNSGGYYSNGALGRDWSVRQIKELVEDDQAVGEKQLVIFKQKAGSEKLKTDCITVSNFLKWAAYEVEPATSGWQKKISKPKY
ncbi:HPP family protein [Thiomicrorhabdus sp. 6S2-11]|uniref:HPP family protein n=1 Tax=Thiomicrorhabdus marina TaxID=2818442 RepID=A0ABS3Q747_9GAMM|nr:HPP family protein [Thiomicrorhabdus marina]